MVQQPSPEVRGPGNPQMLTVSQEPFRAPAEIRGQGGARNFIPVSVCRSHTGAATKRLSRALPPAPQSWPPCSGTLHVPGQELVVQRPREEDADQVRRRHHPEDVLAAFWGEYHVSGADGGFVENECVPDKSGGWFSRDRFIGPFVHREKHECGRVREQQRRVELAAAENGLRHKLPVDRPAIHERTAEVESALQKMGSCGLRRDQEVPVDACLHCTPEANHRERVQQVLAQDHVHHHQVARKVEQSVHLDADGGAEQLCAEEGERHAENALFGPENRRLLQNHNGGHHEKRGKAVVEQPQHVDRVQPFGQTQKIEHVRLEPHARLEICRQRQHKRRQIQIPENLLASVHVVHPVGEPLHPGVYVDMSARIHNWASIAADLGVVELSGLDLADLLHVCAVVDLSVGDKVDHGLEDKRLCDGQKDGNWHGKVRVVEQRHQAELDVGQDIFEGELGPRFRLGIRARVRHPVHS
ncbi:hypothetical protein KL948_002488 [Ogataea haglerorum]|uniref:Uncharacterized protein n=1 Tax=Ogataea haglerorum TaxID=1937702 RepID=A0ABQ7RJG5_9ASCO|nr:hypothetical protein KL948_002488 [Ogataea haglerorum]KAG7766714.1 hypothetical protein KL946_001902 [Ogataea haglerorum]